MSGFLLFVMVSHGVIIVISYTYLGAKKPAEWNLWHKYQHPTEKTHYFNSAEWGEIMEGRGCLETTDWISYQLILKL